MSKKSASDAEFIEFDELPCRLGKFANNLVAVASDEEDEEEEAEKVGVFTFPVSEIMLTAEQLNALYGDPYTHRSWYENKRGLLQPMGWWARVPKQQIALDGKFDGAKVIIAYSDNPSKRTVRDDFEDCRIGSVVLRPCPGGLTEMKFHLQIKPGLGESNLRLQEYQNRRICLSVSGASRVVSLASRQQDLPLNAPGADEEPEGEEIEGGTRRRRRSDGEQPAAH